MAPKIAIAFYTTWGHIGQLAEAEKRGIEKAGGTADMLLVKEQLPDEVLSKMHAPGQKDTKYTILSNPAQLEPYDGILFGIPTRYGTMSEQWRAIWDRSGKQWQSGAFWGKYAGVFVSTGTQGGGQESTALASMSTLTHHGFIYVPLGYKYSFEILSNLEEARGGSPWGAGTFSSGDGSRQPSKLEIQLAEIQGEQFYKAVAKAGGANS